MRCHWSAPVCRRNLTPDAGLTIFCYPSVPLTNRRHRLTIEVAWPTAEGSERVLAPVAEGQEIFVSNRGGGFVNAAAIATSDAELSD